MSGALAARSMLLVLAMEQIWSQLYEKPAGNTSYFTHTLNLLVKWVLFVSSIKALDKLKELQSQLQLPEHRLIQAVDIRWNSVLDMLETV